jgi:hypothetical protein
MRRALALALAMSAVNLSAMADEGSSLRLRPFIGGGYTWGGDTIQALTITPKGSSTGPKYDEDVSAGAGLDLRVGLHLDLPNSPLSLQVSIAHHMDQHSGLDGKTYFRRSPLELVGLWRVTDRLRVGMGMRRSLSSKFSWEGGTCQNGNGDEVTCPSQNQKLKSSTGLILEAEYMVSPDWGVKARYVRESYRFKDESYDPTKYSGDHIGFLTNFYFN